MEPAVDEITLRRMEPGDLDGANWLSRMEGWPHRREEWEFLMAIGTGVVALAQDRIVGTAMLTPYGASAAVCNMIIVDRAVRGRGLGRSLMDAILMYAEDRETRLVATEAGLPLYEKLGFRPMGEIFQYQGVAGPLTMPEGVVQAKRHDLDEIVALDRAGCGMDRAALYAQLIDEEPFFLLRGTDGVRGFASSRAFGRGRVLGPVVAEDEAGAELLMRAGIACHQDHFLRIDLTEAAASMTTIVLAAGLARAGGGIAMTRQGASSTHFTKAGDIFALASQALC